MERFEHDGLRFCYADTGAGRPFVFQHGLGGDAAQPAAQAPAGLRLITLECRGHGDTRPLGPVDHLRFATFARDLDALLDALRLERVVVGGISMGAGVALALARLRPERVAALVLVRPAWTDRGRPPNLVAFLEIAQLLRHHPVPVAKEAFRTESGTYRSIRSESPVAAESLLAQFDRPHARHFAPVLERLPADRPVPSASGWDNLSMPTMVLGCRRDPIHPFGFARWLRQMLPDAVVREVPSKDAGVAAHNEAVAESIDGFLASVAGQ